ncbi:MAG: class GN sortase [Rhizobiales bacterium]|nr:class GN sortase [Hyphomicrobiales bacterium]
MFAAASLHTHKRPALPKRRSFLNLLSVLCLAGGIWMFGQAAWIEAKAIVAQVLLERAFSHSILLGKPVKAWSWADTVPVAKIEVPRLGADAIVLKGASGEALAFGPALLDETALPGAPGTSVIAAHRDTHFTFLKDVVKGDLVKVMRSDGLLFTYRVTGTRIVDWNTSGIDRHAAGFHLVLSTCYPFDAVSRGNQRYLVEAELVR